MAQPATGDLDYPSGRSRVLSWSTKRNAVIREASGTDYEVEGSCERSEGTMDGWTTAKQTFTTW